MKSLIYGEKKRTSYMTCRERSKKKGKRKQLNYAFGRHSKHIITQMLANSLTQMTILGSFLLLVKWRKRRDKTRQSHTTLNEMSLTLEIHLHCTEHTVETIKNFMRKKGSTQVTVRNKYLYMKKSERYTRIEPPIHKKKTHSVGIFIFVVLLCLFF